MNTNFYKKKKIFHRITKIGDINGIKKRVIGRASFFLKFKILLRIDYLLRINLNLK